MANKISNNLFNLLVSKDFTVKTLDAQGKEQSDLAEVEMFSFDFEANDKNFGTVVILLNSNAQMELFFGDNIGKNMDRREKKIWQELLYQLRMFSKRNMLGFQLQNINRLKYSMQSMASVNESFEHIFEGYYGTKKTSYNPQGKAKIIIKHSKNIGENDKRYRNVQSIFIENEGGERFKLPFKKLVGARAMARHVTEGGNPYDIFGLHISEMVGNISTLGGFVRRSKMVEEDAETSSLVEIGRSHYDSMRKGLKQISGKRGYHTYKESWTPSDITETEVDVDSIRQLFTEKSLNAKVNDALPLLARLSENMPDVILDDVEPDPIVEVEEVEQVEQSKELNEFEDWANDIVEGLSDEEKAKNREWNKRPDVAGRQDRGGYETTKYPKKKKIKEGTWSLPNSDHDVRELEEFFSVEQPAGIDAMDVTAKLYNILGDDRLFDNLSHFAHEDPEGDTRGVVLSWMETFINEYPTAPSAMLLDKHIVNFSNIASGQTQEDPEVTEEKDLDSDEQCLSASKDDKITNKGNGMDSFKEYVPEGDEVKEDEKEKEQAEVVVDENNDLSALMQRTNLLLQH